VTDLKQLYESILRGDVGAARETAQQALDGGVDAEVLVERYMTPAMDEVGRLYEKNEYFVPELLISSRAMKAALSVVQSGLASKGSRPTGAVVIGTVAGDLHDIGKNLVAAMLEGAGFAIHDLGVDVPAERFVSAVKEHRPDIVAISALLSTTMAGMKNVLQALEQAGLRKAVKVMIGGAPITPEFASEIGADGYSDNAAGAVREARKWVAG